MNQPNIVQRHRQQTQRQINIAFYLFFLSVFFNSLAWADSLTLQTSYAPPIAVYNRVQLIPKEASYTPPTCNNGSNKIGTIYMNHRGELNLCGNDGKGNIRWVETLNLWTRDETYPNVYYTRNKDLNLKIGIAQENPQATLHVGGEGTIFVRPNQSNSTILLDPARLGNNARLSLWTRADISYINFKATDNITNPVIPLDKTARIWYNYNAANPVLRGLYLQADTAAGKLPNIFITDNGNVAMGSVSNSAPSQKLDVYGTIKIIGTPLTLTGPTLPILTDDQKPQKGKVLTSTDNEGTATWAYAGYAP